MVRKHSIRTILPTLVVAGIAFFVMLVALEFVLRATNMFGARRSWSEPDSRIGWRYTGDREYWFHNENDHPISGRINTHGWRDRNRTLAKAPGAFRVAVLGDSYVEALQVELDSTFLALAERDLVGAGQRSVEILNFGRSGMTQSEELITLRETVAHFSPDMVVVVFVPQNDVADVNPQTAISFMRPFYSVASDGELKADFGFVDAGPYRVRKLINPLKQNSALVSLLTERYNALRRSRRASDGEEKSEKPEKLWAHLTLCTAKPDPVYAANYLLNKRLLDEIAAWCGERSIPLLLMVNALVYMPDQVEFCTDIDPTFDPAFFDRDLGEWSASRGAGFVGLYGEFTRHYNLTGERSHWSHWNYTGHRVVARALAEHVRLAVARRN